MEMQMGTLAMSGATLAGMLAAGEFLVCILLDGHGACFDVVCWIHMLILLLQERRMVWTLD